MSEELIIDDFFERLEIMKEEIEEKQDTSKDEQQKED